MPSKPDYEAILTAFLQLDIEPMLGWNHDEGRVGVFVNVNDLFWWATGDAEEVATPEDIAALKAAHADGCAADKVQQDAAPPNVHYCRGRLAAEVLYAARKRKLRPQNAWLNKQPQYVVDLFLAAGPPREVDTSPFGNPHPPTFKEVADA
jgi:hypothetical protein